MNRHQLKEHIARVKRERAVRVAAPSGLEYRVVRPALSVYLDGGRLPENFVVLMNRVARKEISADQAEAELSPEDSVKYSKFVVALILDSVVEPHIVNCPTEVDGEMDIADVAAIGDFDFLTSYLTGLIPDQPVKTTEGETSVKALEDFRNESELSVPSEPGGDGEQVRTETQPVAGA